MKIPTATYRVQLNDQFRFRHLDAILQYLHELGISTVYASPVTTAGAGSQHGYDVADPLRLNPEIGTEEEFGALAARLRDYGMDWLQDIVPNHMAYSTQNPWLYDVLERGKVSPYYSYFDLHPEPLELLGDRIMAPFLGAPLTECLERGQLTLQYGKDGLVIRYFDNEWPVAAHLYAWICTVTGDCPAKLSGMLEEMVIASLSPVKEWQAAKSRWLRQVDADPMLIEYMRRRAGFFNERTPMLETLLGSQHYALTHHRLSSSLINYRRFFTVNSLICLRMESREVFDAYHRTIGEWHRRGWIQGLRIDHIDGLAAPAEYIDRLRERFGPDCYLIAEKILARDEALPGYWDLQGTTGYEFLAAASQVLTDAAGSKALLEWYDREVIKLPGYPELVTERKYAFLRTYMGGELDNLLETLGSAPALGASGQDAARLREALAMLLACFPVYRLYPDHGAFTPSDRVTIASAFDLARRNRPECREELQWLEGLFQLDAARPFLLRLMQFTGPLAAKGIEDTSFYVYNPYIAHCEVGDTPAVAGIAPMAFHTAMRQRQERWPHSLNATTTHDTKRGEDARVRLNLLSAQPREWIAAVGGWRGLNSSLISWAGKRRAPSANDEYLIYQALLGGWPEDGVITDEFRERFAGYLSKALREAKTETNYDEPDEWYEESCRKFAGALLAEGSAFAAAFGVFAAVIIRESYAFSLAQTLLKLTAPGIPDIYQGAECWETSFVDPDNRRPVDYARRIALLREMRAKEAVGAAAALEFVLDHPERGAMKMWVIYRVLNFRRAHPELFAEGEYLPVTVDGPALGYVRRQAGDWVLVLVPLIGGPDAPTIFRITLPSGAPPEWMEIFTGDIHRTAGTTIEWKGWSRFPVAFLTGLVS
ncbi:MAG TPA: malto-oligosyltrehalose synthase [Puia sp.]|jgi:(1->4)-alpha-D-glucan 1-alpha-D-glucosylmutase|nr:malto-oligosyltrehalose synthase [Puia sp.]